MCTASECLAVIFVSVLNNPLAKLLISFAFFMRQTVYLHLVIYNTE